MLGYTPRADTPQADTPPADTLPLGRHPLGRRTPPGKHLPWADTPRADTPSPTATAADGTHPTGMLSCFNLITQNLNLLSLVDRGYAPTIQTKLFSISWVLQKTWQNRRLAPPGGLAPTEIFWIRYRLLTIRMTWRASTFKLEFSEVDFVAVLPEFIGLGTTHFGDHAADVLQLFLYFSTSGHVVSVDMRVHCKNTTEEECITVGCVPSAAVAVREGWCLPGGCGCVSQHALGRGVSAPVNSWHTLVKTLPFRSFVCERKPVADPGFPRISLSLGQKPAIYCPKVMFSRVFVCPQVGGLCVFTGFCLVTGGVSVQGRSLSGGWSLSRGGLCQGDPLTVKSGRYASYWNAFLFD